ncbi:MAG: hypothetical protein GY732_09245 [Gammaproteobacteria bacterium]|nr:hypothetical protein [Gammaproteobacteria bacterium]
MNKPGYDFSQQDHNEIEHQLFACLITSELCVTSYAPYVVDELLVTSYAPYFVDELLVTSYGQVGGGCLLSLNNTCYKPQPELKGRLLISKLLFPKRDFQLYDPPESAGYNHFVPLSAILTATDRYCQ